MDSGSFQMLFLFVYLVIVIVGLYFIIKLAVKNGILQAYKTINEQTLKKD